MKTEGTDFRSVGIGIIEKGKISAEAIAFARYAMFASAYWHHTSRAFKAMIRFILVNSIYNVPKREEFEQYIFQEISQAVQGLLPMQPQDRPVSNQINEGDHRLLLPASALTGAAFVIIADLLARILLAPVEIPIGVITAIIGAPFFIYLLRHTRKEYAF